MSRSLLLLIVVAAGCRQFSSINAIDYNHIQPYIQKEGFIAVESSRRIPTPPSRIVEIDTNGQLTYFTIPLGPVGTYLSTTLLLNDSTAITKFNDTGNYRISYLYILDMKTGATRLLGKDLEPIAVSAKGDHVILFNGNHVSLYSLGDTLTHLYTVLNNNTGYQPVALSDNSFLVSRTFWRDKKGQLPVYFYLRTGGRKNDMFEPDYFMHETYATDDTAYVFARRGLQSAWTYTPVQKHEIVSEVTTTLLDSLFVNRMLAMPTSEVLIFQGATQKEYREEEEDISRQIEEFERENPGVGCEWGGPRGYWRVFNTRTKKHSRLDQQYEYIAATRSGRHILVRREDDRSVFSVVKTSEIIK